LALCPNLAAGHVMKGMVLVHSGEPKEGRAALQTALRLDPRGGWRAYSLLLIAIGHYYCREYEAAVEAGKRVVRGYPGYPNPYRWLAAALGQLGRSGEAKEALQQAIAIAPNSFNVHVQTRIPLYRQEDYAHMLEGLRKAGWQG
jgi:adenylate cyclase